MDVGCSQWGFEASTMTPQHGTGFINLLVNSGLKFSDVGKKIMEGFTNKIDEAVEINLPTTDAAQSTELDGEQPKKKYKSSNSKNPKKTKKPKFQLLRSNTPQGTV